MTVSYAELNHRVLLLGEYLRLRGVGPDSVVGIFMSPSIEYVVAIMGAHDVPARDPPSRLRSVYR